MSDQNIADFAQTLGFIGAYWKIHEIVELSMIFGSFSLSQNFVENIKAQVNIIKQDPGDLGLKAIRLSS